MERIEQDTNSKYHKLRLDYTYGLNTIYDVKEIERKKQDIEFKREYECQYGYGLGNIFRPQDIQACLDLYTNDDNLNNNNNIRNNYSSVSLGADPGFGSSSFGICVLGLQNSILKVLYAQEFERASYEEMINLIGKLRYEFRPDRCYLDSAAPEFIRSLKVQFSENPDYESVIAQATREKVDPDYKMQVIPVSFAIHGKELLGRFQHMVSKKWFTLSSEKHSELLQQMRVAKYQPNGNLEKSITSTSTFDLLDACRLSLKMFSTSEKGGNR